MNLLYEKFPETVLVDGVEYKVVTDFREWIKLYDLLNDDDIDEYIKANIMLEWFDGEIPPNIEEALKALGRFLAAYELYDDTKKGKSKGRLDVPAFSFSEDAKDIYSAFLNYYDINIQNIDYMHWYEFRTLFDTLPFESEIKQKMHYRTLDPMTIKDTKERKRVREIQESIKLNVKTQHYVDDYEIGDVFG